MDANRHEGLPFVSFLFVFIRVHSRLVLVSFGFVRLVGRGVK